MELTGAQRKEFQEALLEAFPGRAALEQMLDHYVEPSLSLADIPESGSPNQTIFELIKYCAAHNRLDDLLTGACAANSGNAKLRGFRESLAPPTALRQRLAAYLRQRYELADLRGLVAEEHAGLHANPVRLQAIYVPLRATVVEHRPALGPLSALRVALGVAPATKRADPLSAMRATAGPPGENAFLAAMREGVRDAEPEVGARAELPIAQAPAPREHTDLDPLVAGAPVLIVLGDPGSGKSTALKHYALAALAADDGPLPLLLPLAAYAQELKDAPSLGLLDFAARFYEGRGVPDLKPLFQHAARNGQIVYLLDGLDEVPGDLRGQVADMVTALAHNRGGNRLVATSRITGYIPLVLQEYQEATIERLGDEQIAAFADKWYAAFFAGRQPGGAEARQTAARLLEIIRTNPGVAKLADNPLTLTMLALLFFAGNAELPRRRVKLYGLIAHTLIGEWRKARNLAGMPIGSGHDELEVLQQVGPLAYWMHENKPEGIASRDEVAQVLARVERAAHPDEDPLPRVNRFLAVLSHEVGILSEKGAGQWGFSHQTFQEYFAAREIARWRQVRREAEIRRRAPDPRWTEVIRLALAYLGSEVGATEDVTELVSQTILDRPDPYEPYLHRNLLLAGRVLADDPGVPMPVVLSIARRLFDLWLETRVATLAESASTILRDLLGAPLRISVLGWIGEAVEAKRFDARFGVFAGEPGVQAALLPFLADPDPSVRANAAAALGAIAGEPEVQAALLPLLADPDPGVRGTAAMALRAVAREPGVLVALLAFLVHAGRGSRPTAAMALGASAGEPGVQAALLPFLADPNPDVRANAAFALEAVAGVPGVQAALLPLLADPHSYVRWNAAGALRAVVGEPAVQAALLPLLADPHSSVREGVAGALKAVAGEPAVQAALLVLLAHPDHSVRGTAAGALKAAAGEPAVQAALLPLFADPHPYVRGATARALGAVAGEPAVRGVLLSLLADPESSVRRAAIGALTTVAGEPGVLAALLSLLADPESSVRLAVAGALSDVADISQVRAVLLLALNDPRSSQAIEVLANLPPDAATCARLGALLDSSYFEVADAAFATLTRWAAVEDAAGGAPT